jgi:hypothetical protein
MKREGLISHYEKNLKKKKTFKFFLGNFLLQNLIAIVVYVVAKQFDEKINIYYHFLINNIIALIV